MFQSCLSAPYYILYSILCKRILIWCFKHETVWLGLINHVKHRPYLTEISSVFIMILLYLQLISCLLLVKGKMPRITLRHPSWPESWPPGQDENLLVQTSEGPVMGGLRHTNLGIQYRSYQGIPFAAPPTGSLRYFFCLLWGTFPTVLVSERYQ